VAELSFQFQTTATLNEALIGAGTVTVFSGTNQITISGATVSGEGQDFKQVFTNVMQVICNHNFGTIIHSTTVIGSTGQVVEGEITYGINTDTVDFNQNQSGTVVITL